MAATEAPVPDSWKKERRRHHRAGRRADHSIRVLLIDESAAASYIPWHRIEPKLSRENPLAVTFAATRGGYARHAQYALPVAVYPELTDDIAPAVDSARPVFPDLRSAGDAPAGLANPADFAGALALEYQSSNSLRERADAIHKAGLGSGADIRRCQRDSGEGTHRRCLLEGIERRAASGPGVNIVSRPPGPKPLGTSLRRLPNPRAICP